MPRDEKDIILKTLVGTFSDGALNAIGISDVCIVEPLPTELNTESQRVDMAWKMDNGDVFHLEFQSTRESSLYRFLEYDAKLARRYQAKIRTVILYHTAVKTAPEELDIGTAQYRVENVFLAHFDGDSALDRVEDHIKSGMWVPEDRIRLALALNMRFQRRSRSEAFDDVLTLVKLIPSDQERDLIGAALLGLTDRILTQAERDYMKRELIKMSQLAKEIYEDGMHEGIQEGRMEEKKETAKKLLREGWTPEKVAEFVQLPVDMVKHIED